MKPAKKAARKRNRAISSEKRVDMSPHFEPPYALSENAWSHDRAMEFSQNSSNSQKNNIRGRSNDPNPLSWE